MKTRPILFVAGAVTLGLAGCGSPESRITGTWKMDVEATAGKLLGGETTNPMQGALKGIMESTLRAMHMSVVFRKDGKVFFDSTMGEFRSEVSGTWRVIQSGEDSMTVGATLDNVESAGEQQISIRFLDADRIEMTPPDGASQNQPVVFTRE